MGKYFLGVATVLIVIAVAAGSLWLCNLVGMINLQDLILNRAGQLAGIKNLTDTYKLGKKHSDALAEKEFELANKERQLVIRETKLQTDFTNLQDQKQAWQRKMTQANKNGVSFPQANSSGTNLSQASSGSATGKTGITPAVTPDPTVKNYLAVLGAMKAEKAAAVVQKLPDQTVLLLLSQLRKADAAKLMENLPSEYVTRLTQTRLNLTK